VKNGKTQTRKEMDLHLLVEIIKKHNPSKAFLEKVTARPGQGVTSMFRFGQNFGEHEGVLVALGIDISYITPQTWKKHFKLPSEKDASSTLAREIWPEHEKVLKLKKNNGLAEAALIGKFGYDTSGEQ
jgi:crossover junction endodeoxyribonuclease RuvC